MPKVVTRADSGHCGHAAAGRDTRCPRCGGAFHCGAADPAPCACTTIRLDASTLAALRGRYQGCLCLACLATLAAEQATRAELSAVPPAARS